MTAERTSSSIEMEDGWMERNELESDEDSGGVIDGEKGGCVWKRKKWVGTKSVSEQH